VLVANATRNDNLTKLTNGLTLLPRIDRLVSLMCLVSNEPIVSVAALGYQHSVVPVSVSVDERSREVLVSQPISRYPAITVLVVPIQRVQGAERTGEGQSVVVLEKAQKGHATRDRRDASPLVGRIVRIPAGRVVRIRVSVANRRRGPVDDLRTIGMNHNRSSIDDHWAPIDDDRPAGSLVAQPIGSFDRNVPLVSQPLAVFLALMLHAVLMTALLLLPLTPGLRVRRHR